MDENAIRKLTIKELHDEMDKQVARRASRFQYAAPMRDTTTQWDLVAAAVEEANISYHGLIGKDFTKRQVKDHLQTKCENILAGIQVDEEIAEKVQRTTWLKKAAGDHTAMGNKLINVARRMNVNARSKGEHDKVKLDHRLIATTMVAYSGFASNANRRQMHHYRAKGADARTQETNYRQKGRNIQRSWVGEGGANSGTKSYTNGKAD